MLRSLSKRDTIEVPFCGAVFVCRLLSLRDFRALESGGGNAALIEVLGKGVVGWSNVLVDDPRQIENLRAADAELAPTETEGVFELKYRADLIDAIFDVTDAGVLLGLIAEGKTKPKP